MPLYEYQCKKCKHRFEKIQLFSDRPIKKCPNCGESAVEKLLSAPAVHFKGSGFYQTDYANKKSAPEVSSSAELKSDGKPSSGKSDSATGISKTSGEKSSDSSSKTEKSSTESRSAAEPKGDPRGRSTHSKKARRK